MTYIITLNGKKYEVEVEKGEATAVYLGAAETVTTAAPAPTAAPAAPAAPVAAPAAPVATGDGDPIKCPMPGTILDVKTNSGASVQEGDVLFILEAMKMENEIVAPRAGTITSVTVSKGATVQTDQILATLK